VAVAAINPLALNPLAVLDTAPSVVLDLDEARRLRIGRTVEHDVDKAAIIVGAG
jgi:hypothetical protein